mgnify:CR=1 FL=1
MSRAPKSYLADVNVCVALVYDRHLHHGLVRRWFQGLRPPRRFFCRLTQLGFLRLLTARPVMGADTVSQREAWKLYDQVMRDSRVGFLSGPADAEAALGRSTERGEAASRVWSDAYLAAVAPVAGLVVAMLDQGFATMKGSDVTLLQALRW